MVLVAPKRNMVQKLAQPEEKHQSSTNTEYRFVSLLERARLIVSFTRSFACRFCGVEKQGINCVASHARGTCSTSQQSTGWEETGFEKGRPELLAQQSISKSHKCKRRASEDEENIFS